MHASAYDCVALSPVHLYQYTVAMDFIFLSHNWPKMFVHSLFAQECVWRWTALLHTTTFVGSIGGTMENHTPAASTPHWGSSKEEEMARTCFLYFPYFEGAGARQGSSEWPKADGTFQTHRYTPYEHYWKNHAGYAATPTNAVHLYECRTHVTQEVFVFSQGLVKILGSLWFRFMKSLEKHSHMFHWWTIDFCNVIEHVSWLYFPTLTDSIDF